ncbi:MAG: hypothetical protein L6R40_000609 [Gallowayella cf. fulva]|nr:MAG: hypothetical protein L6R40_000609 [Xanthomendoza cf. fulva]
MATVIIGAGIIGTSTAYYLSQSDTLASSIHLIESSPQLFASASGYAAGFLARDWFSPASASLGRLSFDLHKRLAKEQNGYEKWGYSRSTATSLAVTIGGEEEEDWVGEGRSRARAAKRIAENDDTWPVWLAPRHGRPDIIDNGDGTAQIDPYELCQFLLSECKSQGVNIHQPAKATSVTRDSDGSLSSIHIKSTDTSAEYDIPCTRLVLAAGAWTSQVFQALFPSSKLRVPVSSLAGHSLLLRSPHWPPPNPDIIPSSGNTTNGHANGSKELPSSQPPCHALFTSDPIASYAPELFSRLPSGHIYIAGFNGPYPLPDLPTERVIDPEAIETLKGTAERLLGKGEFEVEREALCFRPVTGRGVPIVGPARKEGADGEEGVWIAAGHGPWGISMSLGTGMVVAEMVEGRKVSADLKGLGL